MATISVEEARHDVGRLRAEIARLQREENATTDATGKLKPTAVRAQLAAQRVEVERVIRDADAALRGGALDRVRELRRSVLPDPAPKALEFPKEAWAQGEILRALVLALFDDGAAPAKGLRDALRKAVIGAGYDFTAPE